MKYDINFIKKICSVDILLNKCAEEDMAERINWIQKQDLRYEFEERAAILEYDGGLSRSEADKKAIDEILASVVNMNKRKT